MKLINLTQDHFSDYSLTFWPTLKDLNINTKMKKFLN